MTKPTVLETLRLTPDKWDTGPVETACRYGKYCEAADLIEAYHELIYAVATKTPGESRHQTALRYIRQAETHDYGQAQQGSPEAKHG